MTMTDYPKEGKPINNDYHPDDQLSNDADHGHWGAVNPPSVPTGRGKASISDMANRGKTSAPMTEPMPTSPHGEGRVMY